MDDFYQRIADVYRNVLIKPEQLDHKGRLISKKLIMIPVDKQFHQLGATILLAYLAFPADTEAKQRSKFVNLVNAKPIKLKYPQNSPERKKYQKFTSIPNKKINQFLGVGKGGAGYRVNMRMRAADVMWRKLHSNPDKQDSLRAIASQMAKVDTDAFPAFTNKDEDEVIDSFIKRIIWPTKPIMHLAMGSYLHRFDHGMVDEPIVSLILKADEWLVETLFLAEMIRAEFNYLFPRKNLSVDVNNTLAFFPIQGADIPEQMILDQLS